MAPRRSARSTTSSKPSKPVLGKAKVTKSSTAKSTTKRTTTQKPAVKAKKTRSTTITTVMSTKTFPCGCATAACNFKLPENDVDLRIIIGRPEYNENPTVQCACKVHYKCAKRWAKAHDELPTTLPCGCSMTKRGEDFWVAAVVGRKEELKKKKREEIWADVDSGSDLTDLED
jgi:hypothetical protein